MAKIKMTEENFTIFRCAEDEEFTEDGENNEGLPDCIGPECHRWEPDGMFCQYGEFDG